MRNYSFILLFLILIGLFNCQKPVENELNNSEIISLEKNWVANCGKIEIKRTLHAYVADSNYRIGIWPPFYWYSGGIPPYGLYKDKYGFSYALFKSYDHYFRAIQDNWDTKKLYRILAWGDPIAWFTEFPGVLGIYIDEPFIKGARITKMDSIYNSLKVNNLELVVSDVRDTLDSEIDSLKDFVQHKKMYVMYSSYSLQNQMWNKYESFFYHPFDSVESDKCKSHWINISQITQYEALLDLAKSIGQNEVWLYCADTLPGGGGHFSFERLEAFCDAAVSTGWLERLDSVTYADIFCYPDGHKDTVLRPTVIESFSK
ncbi:MAG: hypothetical protein K9I69_03330 [Ignavibacteriales bacterium]|nr:hypothetical protein [Ignavibacteriales bacterium]MCF8305683.1 hypothetical protein [Ignavibacteriales bacterium]MCF8315405.1 hypothetical protein [Ignavibacteriales bacterium]MCF8436703.1 hypothetical protein [Ignavibacteriales bacterium]